MLRDSTLGSPATTWRRMALACLVALAAAVAAPAASAAPAADAPGASAPRELWRAYPLEQPATTGAGATPTRSPASGDAAARARSPAQGAGEKPPWTALLAVVVAGGTALVLLALIIRRNRAALARYAGRRRPTDPEHFFDPGEDSVPRAGAVAPARPPPPEHVPVAPARGQVCEVRWLPGHSGSRFCAVTRDAAGSEHRLGLSPRIAAAGASPPEQTPEAQRALRQLAKELRENGWKPLRAKGSDFGEPQWYARRFRRPALDPDAGPAPAGEPSGEAGGGARGTPRAGARG